MVTHMTAQGTGEVAVKTAGWWRKSARWSPVLLVLIAIIWMALDPRPFADWFLLPEQQADRLFKAGKYQQAASRYSDPQRVGAAWYRAGDFKQAANAFARSNTAVSHYNRGNALVMSGKYEQAIEAYDRSLELLPDWGLALNNREIARLRAERLVKQGGEMTGGKMAADEFVFDLDPSKGGENQAVEGEEKQALNDQQIQALWLRRVQTRPADFLQARFAYQLAAQESAGSADE